MCVRAVESVRCSASAHVPQRLAETGNTLLRGLSWFQQFSLGREMTHPAGLCPQPAGLLGGLCGGACFSTTRSGSGVWNLVLFHVVPVWLADTGVTSGTTRFNVNAPLKGTSQLLSALCRNSVVPVPSFLSDPQTLRVCLGRSPWPAQMHRSLDPVLPRLDGLFPCSCGRRASSPALPAAGRLLCGCALGTRIRRGGEDVQGRGRQTEAVSRGGPEGEHGRRTGLCRGSRTTNSRG